MSLPLLRLALFTDAAVGAASGVLILSLIEPVAGMTGMPTNILVPVMLVLVALASFIACVATRPAIPRLGVMLVICANALWVAGSIAIVFPGVLPLTDFGIALVVVQAAAVVAVAVLQAIGISLPTTRTA